jgi:chitinase
VLSPLRIRDIEPRYNLIYLFAATAREGDTSGAVKWDPPSDVNGAWTNWRADIQYARTTQKRKIILSVGGAGHGMAFPNRTVTTNFVNSIDALYSQWGGFDGLDWNTFEGSQTPDTAEMIWASQELKRRHPGFIISAPPAPWNTVDQKFCRDMLTAGALDYCAPQYYDGPNLADPAWALPNIDTWVNLLGANHVVIGYGIDPNAANYWNITSAVNAWKQIKAKHPAVRGVFNWQINSDRLQGWPFAQQLAPLVP